MPLTDRQTEFKGWIKRQFFDQSGVLTFEDLETKAIELAGVLFKDLNATEIGEVTAELTQENNVVIPLGDSIVDPQTFAYWIAERSQDTATPRWDAYTKLLVDRDWESPVIEALETQTDELVELLGDPKQIGPWARHGLLMGEVQSGKTATYLGILNKALDHGYRLVIVIGGHTEDLRRQTQARFDTDLLGVDSETWDSSISNAAIRHVGVGEISRLRANLMTTVGHDFSRTKVKGGIAWLNGETPTVFVVKKNAKLIGNVKDYIKGQAGPGGKLDLPLAVIDDESDWGTPNTGGDTDPTSVNREIRKLLAVSSRSSYLGITATPFANIFIDSEATYDHAEGEGDAATMETLADLFPSDYIRVMFPPSSYLGIGTYFPDGGHSAINVEVRDCLQVIPIKHNKNLPVLELPGSMKTAIIEFLLGTAARRIRDQKVRAASMLINVSRFKDVQRRVRDLANDFLQETVATVLAEFARRGSAMSPAATAIRDVWYERYANVQDLTWPEVASNLLNIAHEFRVELVNGDTAKKRAKDRSLMTREQRMADDLLPTIYVGGDILSRGLTLDGLQVSYFVREPRTMDTLMQTGRWFGYRPHFADLVRLWIPEGTRDDFTHSAEVTNELRDSLLEMKARQLTPRDFGLRVRMHPDSVDIVAANKARHTEVVDVGPIVFERRLIEAHLLSDDVGIQEANQEAVRELISALGGKGTVARSSGEFDVWHGVHLDTILDFFRRFRGHPNDLWWGRSSEGTPAIADQFTTAPGNENWDVVLVGSGTGDPLDLGHGFSVKRSIRNKMGHKASDHLIKVSRRRVSTPGDLISSLTSADRREIETESSRTTSSQARALGQIDHPILMIYAIAAPVPDQPEDSDFATVPVDTTLITVAIAFPSMSQEEINVVVNQGQRYRVNMVWWRNVNGYVDDEGDDVPEEEGES